VVTRHTVANHPAARAFLAPLGQTRTRWANRPRQTRGLFSRMLSNDEWTSCQRRDSDRHWRAPAKSYAPVVKRETEDSLVTPAAEGRGHYCTPAVGLSGALNSATNARISAACLTSWDASRGSSVCHARSSSAAASRKNLCRPFTISLLSPPEALEPIRSVCRTVC
jgi:hypothetical protein